MIGEDPSGARFVAACLLAAAVAPVPAALMLLAFVSSVAGVGSAVGTLIFGFPVALLHVLLLALPAYQVLRRWWRLRWWSSVVAGLFIGMLPLAAISGPWTGVGVAGLCGAAGGLAFWAVLRGATSNGRPGNLDETFA